ncbi:MAG: hypothetical protein ACRD2W_20840, partial [Acidimicrobiales bacterium]
MTVLADRIVGPDQQFVAGTTVAVRLVAALDGEGAGMEAARSRSVQGIHSQRLVDEWFAIDLVPNIEITSPLNTYYQVLTHLPGRPAVTRAFTAPAAPPTTTTTAPVVLPAATVPVASTAAFAASGFLSAGGHLLAYTAKTATTFTGVTGGAGGATIANGATVAQAYWVGSQLVTPPTELPLPIPASSVSFVPSGGLSSVTVQNALVELDAEKVGLASPAFTGTPTAPTAVAGTNTTQLATTAFVQVASGLLVPKAGGTMTGSLVVQAHSAMGLGTVDQVAFGAPTSELLNLRETFTGDFNASQRVNLYCEATFDPTTDAGSTSSWGVLSNALVKSGNTRNVYESTAVFGRAEHAGTGLVTLLAAVEG